MSPRGAFRPVVGRHWAKLRYVAPGEAPNRSEDWELDTSAPQDVRFIYVKFWTRKVADVDVEQYLPQNGEHQENMMLQTSEVTKEAQNSIEGPAQINNGEEAKSISSTSDSSDTSSSGSSDSSSEDSDSSEGILPPSGHQKVSPGQ
ncbi:hypothetical protein AOLI_G00217980 [Acnodon oligacanthus]